MVVARLNRLVGASLGLVFTLAVAALGTVVYAAGGAVGLVAYRLPQVGFYIVCAVLALLQLFSLRAGLAERARARKRQREALDQDY